MLLHYYKKKRIVALAALYVLLCAASAYAQDTTVAAQTVVVNDSLGVTRQGEPYIRSPRTIDVLYGTAERRHLLGAVSTVYTNQLSTTPASLYVYALPGRLAGLYTEQSSGFRMPATAANYDVDIFVGNIPKPGSASPSDNTEIGLRLRGQIPVTLIDGVQRDIYSIDPENIESVSVLKDALSTILLGQRSSRGILLVTTKKAQAGRTRISFTAQRGYQQSLKLPKPLPAYQYAYLLNEALQNDGKAPVYTYEDFNAFRNGTDPAGHPDVNWYNEILRDNAPISRYNLNVTGGGSTARYAVSLNYTDQQGMFKTSSANSYNTNASLQRYVVNTDLDVNVTKRFTVGMQLFGRLQNGNQPGGTTSGILSDLLATPNNAYPVRNPNGSWGGTNSFQNNLLSRVIGAGYIEDNAKDVMANIALGYDMGGWVEGLSAKFTTNISIQSLNAINRSKQDLTYKFSRTQDGDTTYAKFGEARSQSNDFITVFNARYWFAQASLNYDRSFGRHGISASVLADQQQTTFNYDLPGKLNNLSAKAAYNFDGRYFASAAVNYSGFNRYQPGKQYGVFYAAGVGWDLAKESFLHDNAAWLDQLKLRATYGRTGNGVDNSGYYIWRPSFSHDNGVGGGIYDQGTARSPAPGYEEYGGMLSNVNISWEKAHKLDIGADISLFGDKVQVTADYYHDRYYDLLQWRGKSIALIGLNYPPENIGINLYTGKELTISYQDHAGKFHYFFTGNVSIESSKVIFADEQHRSYPWNVRTGLPVGMPFGYIADGLFQTAEEAAGSATIAGYTPKAGDIRYRDLNKDGVIDQLDETAIGSTKPVIYFGVTAGFSFRGIECSALLQGVQNRLREVNNFATEAGFLYHNGSYGQAYEQVLGRWTPETAATATYPRLTALANENNQQRSTFWMRSGNYFRLKNISIAYNFPYHWTSRLHLAGVKIFANAQNLFTHAAYDWIDPEVGVGAYPIQRVMNAGINVKL